MTIIGCNSSTKKEGVIQEISAIQKEIRELTSDSSSLKLKKAQNLINLHSNFIPDSLKAENSYLIGEFYQNAGKLDSAAVYYQKATDYVKDSLKTQREADYFYSTWDLYLDKGEYGNCLALSKRFMSLIEQSKDKRLLKRAYYFDETVYKRRRDYKNAIEFNKLRISVLEQLNDTIMKGSALNSLASLEYNLGNSTRTYAILDSLIDARKTLTPDLMRQIYGDYGVYKFYDGEFRKARDYYQKGIKYTKQTSDSIYKIKNLATDYGNLSEVCIILKDTNNAKKYLDSIQFLGLANIRTRTLKFYFNNRANLAFLTEKNYSKARKHIDEYVDFLEESYTDKFEEELIALEIANENEKLLGEEKQRTEIEKANLESRLLLLAIITALLILIGYLFYRQRKFRFERQSLIMQQRLLRTQMNPHFTFNALYAIQNKIKEDPQLASNYLLSFSRLLRLILENSMKNYVQLEKELESLKKYLELQLLRFPNKFTYEVHLKNLEEDELLFIPPMLIQPFVENSIEHGFKGIDYQGHISIELELQDKFIHCTIVDNGKGLSESQNQTKQSASATLISQFLKKSTGQQVNMRNIISKDNKFKGTEVSFLIPFKLTEYD